MNAAIYTRISRDDDQVGLGVARQLLDCRTLAERKGWTLLGYTENDQSAASERNRKIWRTMLRDIADGRVQSVVAWANDRLYRNVQDQLDLLKAVKGAGGLIATVKDGEVDPSTAEGAMRMGILANVAEFESRRKSERLLRKHEELASAGRWSGGPRPFGYDRDANGRLTVVVLSEASAIRDAAERILNGEALRSVTRRWNDRGLRTSWGNRWEPKAVKGVLTSLRVAGRRVHRGEDTGKAEWPPILTRATWLQLRDEFERRAADAVQPGAPWTHLLTSFLVCNECGETLTCQPQRGRPSYTCLSRRSHPKGARVRIMADPLEETVSRWAAERAIGRHTAEDPAAMEQDILGALDSAEKELVELRRHWKARDLEDVEYEEDRRVLRLRIADLKAQLVQAVPPSPTWSEFYGSLQELPETWAEYIAEPETKADVRADLESKVAGIVVFPANRNKWLSVDERVQVVWREGVTS